VERGIRSIIALYLLRFTFVSYDFYNQLWSPIFNIWVTWRHLSRDHWTCNIRFPISDPLKAPLSRMVAEILHDKHLATTNYHWKCSDHHFFGAKRQSKGWNYFRGLRLYHPPPRHVFWAINRHCKSPGLFTVVLKLFHWKCITGKNWDKIGKRGHRVFTPNKLDLTFETL